jgi:hypothetical protein
VRDFRRGVSYLNAKDLSALVDKYMNQSGGPPPIKRDVGGNVENIENLVGSFSSMISACMQIQYYKHAVELLDLKIKVFLSDHATFDNAMKSQTAASNTVPQGNDMMDFNPSDDEDEDVLIDGINNMREDGDFGGDYDEEDEIDQVGVKKKKKDKPKWLMSYSHICLRNLPLVIEKIGPLHLYWEDGGLGEKVLKQLNLLWIGFRKNCQMNTLKDIYQRGELIRIRDEIHDDRKISKPKMFHIYSDYITVRNTFMKNTHMSVVALEDGPLGIAFGAATDGSFSIFPLTLESCHGKQLGISLFNAATHFEGIMHVVRETALRKYCVSLPDLNTTGLPSFGGNKVFTFINSDWEKICQDKTFCI